MGCFWWCRNRKVFTFIFINKMLLERLNELPSLLSMLCKLMNLCGHPLRILLPMILEVNCLFYFMSLQVGTNFDLKELIFRNYGKLMGPFDDISLRHEWGPGSEFTASFAWVDPTNVIAASYDVKIPVSYYVGNQSPVLKKPLRPGIWSSKVMINLKLVAETQFLVSPLTFYSNKPVPSSIVHRLHQGPDGAYTATDFSEFMPNLGLVDSPQLRLEAEVNSRKTEEDLEQWIDSLTQIFWFTRQTCILSSSNTCASIPLCNVSSWSSRSPDIKSDPKYIGSKIPLIR